MLTLCFPTMVFATNGMNMEGYGPIATAMGGAAQGYDNGSAAIMANPATIGLMQRSHRLDVAVGNLRPSVKATVTTNAGDLETDSNGDSYFMPALGWVRQGKKFGFGFGVFGQGGMGTDYEGTSWMGNPAQSATSPNLENRSELSVGRAILPIIYKVNRALTFGASVDFVWAGMDLKMALSEAQFQNLANPQAQTIGTASGTLRDSFGAIYEPFDTTQSVVGINNLHYAYFDFSNSSDYTGEASATGYAGKLGFTYRINSLITIGGSYHSKTRLSDLESDNATMTMAVNGDTGVLSTGTASGTDGDVTIPVTGKIKVNDFQWPANYALGVAIKPTKKWLLVADIKYIAWEDVMKNFSMTFTADAVASNGSFGGKIMDMSLFQNWDDQTVYSAGAAYSVTKALTLRGGVNHASNPIPDKYLNALFPAIVETHITGGIGYLFRNGASVDFSVVKGLEGENANPGDGVNLAKVTSAHSQLNWQLMVSYLY